MNGINIPRVDSKDFRAPRCGGEPRVVLNNVKEWRALREWNPKYLNDVAGASVVSLREVDGPPQNVYQNLLEGGKILFSQYLEWVLETANGEDFKHILKESSSVKEIVRAVRKCGFEKSYYLDTKLHNLLGNLVDDVLVPHWYSTDPIDIFFWCGILGTSSGLHFDLTPNCNVQVVGSKTFILYPPNQGRVLYRISGGSHCRFDPNDPDFDQFPMALQARFWHCTLQPGESLFIPAGWFHQVTVMSAWAINVNFFWLRQFPNGLITPELWELIIRRGLVRLYAKLVREVKGRS